MSRDYLDYNNDDTPVRGTDYWTPEDVAAVEAHIDQKVAEATAPTE